MKKLLLTMLMIISLSMSVNATTGTGDGGGNLYSLKISEYIGLIGEEGEKLKLAMVDYLEYFAPFEESNIKNEAGKKIMRMLRHDLLQDIKNSKYIIDQGRCYDEDGYEVQASTQRDNRFENQNAEHHDVCINLAKIASDNVEANIKYFVALLMHEHARHYGFEDTDRFNRHPIVDYVIGHYHMIQMHSREGVFRHVKNEFTKDFSSGKLVRIADGFWVHSEKPRFYAPALEEKVNATFTEAGGNCNRVFNAYTEVLRDRENNRTVTTGMNYIRKWVGFTNEEKLLGWVSGTRGHVFNTKGSLCRGTIKFSRGKDESKTYDVEFRSSVGFGYDRFFIPMN